LSDAQPLSVGVGVGNPEANLVAGVAWLQGAYTIRRNHRHQLFGRVFSGRYKAQLVEAGESSSVTENAPPVRS
jgi:hypothetical protein